MRIVLISGWFTLSDCTRQTVDIAGDSQTHIKFESIGIRGQCEVTLKTYRDDRLMVFFDKLNISGSLVDTWLEFHDGTSRGSPYIGGNFLLLSQQVHDVLTTSN